MKGDCGSSQTSAGSASRPSQTGSHTPARHWLPRHTAPNDTRAASRSRARSAKGTTSSRCRSCGSGATTSMSLSEQRRRDSSTAGSSTGASPSFSSSSTDLTSLPRPCSGAIGSGLAILSRHPIVSAFVSPYPLNGFPLHFIEGDFFAGKAVCGVCVDVEGVGKVDVLNTHMYAPGGEGDTITGAHRVAQAWELARIATEKAERGRHVLVVRPDPIARSQHSTETCTVADG